MAMACTREKKNQTRYSYGKVTDVNLGYIIKIKKIILNVNLQSLWSVAPDNSTVTVLNIDSFSIKTSADLNPVALYFHTQDYQAKTIIK